MNNMKIMRYNIIELKRTLIGGIFCTESWVMQFFNSAVKLDYFKNNKL